MTKLIFSLFVAVLVFGLINIVTPKTFTSQYGAQEHLFKSCLFGWIIGSIVNVSFSYMSFE